MGVVARSIVNEEVSRHAYSVKHDDLLKTRESEQAKILDYLKELSAAELNEYIADREKSSNLRIWLSTFVVDSQLRSRGFRMQQRELMEHSRIRLMDNAEASMEAIRAKLSAEEKCALSRFSNDLYGSTRKFEARFAEPYLTGDAGEAWYRWYAGGSWRFDKAIKGRQYITSDIPSTSFSLLKGMSHPQREQIAHQYGVREDVIFVMPLSPRLSLMGQCVDTTLNSLAPKIEINCRIMDSANQLVFRNAHRFVYASSKEEILQAARQLEEEQEVK